MFLSINELITLVTMHLTRLITMDVTEVNVVQTIVYTFLKTNLLVLKLCYKCDDKFVVKWINFYVLIIKKMIILVTKHLTTMTTVDVKAVNFVRMI